MRKPLSILRRKYRYSPKEKENEKEQEPTLRIRREMRWKEYLLYRRLKGGNKEKRRQEDRKKSKETETKNSGEWLRRTLIGQDALWHGTGLALPLWASALSSRECYSCTVVQLYGVQGTAYLFLKHYPLID